MMSFQVYCGLDGCIIHYRLYIRLMCLLCDYFYVNGLEGYGHRLTITSSVRVKHIQGF